MLSWLPRSRAVCASTRAAASGSSFSCSAAYASLKASSAVRTSHNPSQASTATPVSAGEGRGSEARPSKQAGRGGGVPSWKAGRPQWKGERTDKVVFGGDEEAGDVWRSDETRHPVRGMLRVLEVEIAKGARDREREVGRVKARVAEPALPDATPHIEHAAPLLLVALRVVWPRQCHRPPAARQMCLRVPDGADHQLSRLRDEQHTARTSRVDLLLSRELEELFLGALHRLRKRRREVRRCRPTARPLLLQRHCAAQPQFLLPVPSVLRHLRCFFFLLFLPSLCAYTPARSVSVSLFSLSLFL